MTRILIAAVCVCLAGSPALAQSSSQGGTSSSGGGQSSSSSSSGRTSNAELSYEVGGGYAYSNADVNHTATSVDNTMPKGWTAAFTWWAAEGVGVNVDIGGHYGPQYFGSVVGTVDASLHTYQAGVKVKHPLGKFEVNARLIGGFAHSTGAPGGENDDTTAIAVTFGGGADLPLGERFGIRLAQVDIFLSGAVQHVTTIVTVGAYYRW